MSPKDQEFEAYLEQMRTLREQVALRFRSGLKEFADMAFGGDTRKAVQYLFPTETKEMCLEQESRSIKPKYRNPENPLETWSGRGRLPRWMERQIREKGMKKEDFLIKDDESDL